MKVVTHLRFKHKKIILENIQLYPSDVYSATISGVFDVDKTVSLSDTVTDGSVFGYSKINSKTININIFIKNHDDIQSHLKINNLLAKKTLKLTLEYDYLGVIQNNITVTSKSTSEDYEGVISIVATAYDPYFYTQEEILYLGTVFSDGLTFPTSFPFSFGEETTGGTGKVINKGFVDAYPVITISGACNNFTLTNETTGQTNIFEYSLESNDELIIDCRPSTLGITLNGIKQQNQDIVFYRCVSGDNIWTFTRDTPVSTVRNCKIALQSRIL
jgi:hypothetical protein